MKKILFIILITNCSLSLVQSQTGWVQQISGTGYNLNSVFFLDTNTGYVVGDTTIATLRFHIILKTTNAGLSWINQTNPFPNNQYALKSVFFLDANTGYACGGECK